MLAEQSAVGSEVKLLLLDCFIVFKLYRVTARKMKFSIKEFFSKCDQIRRMLRIWSHLLKNSLMENLIFCAVRANNSFFKSIIVESIYFNKIILILINRAYEKLTKSYIEVVSREFLEHWDCLNHFPEKNSFLFDLQNWREAMLLKHDYVGNS